MKKQITALLIWATATTLQSQDLLEIRHSCSFDGEEQQTEFYAFEASGEANQIISKIVKAVNLPQNFVVKSADCKNALATVRGRDRYILYNTTFLEQFKKDARTKWAAYCVLAHEIGHHLSNHDIENPDAKARRRMELEADKFAGGVLFMLGASLEESQAGIQLLQNQGETTTHPPARARAEAIANGWKNSQENVRQISGGQNSEVIEPTTPGGDGNKMVPPSPDKNAGNLRKSTTLPAGNQPATKQQPTSTETNFTEVSDALHRQYIVGNWECSFYSGYGLVTNYATFYPNGSAFGQAYLNGNAYGSVSVTYTIEKGIYTELDLANGIYNRYRIQFNGTNNLLLTFAETSGSIIPFPVGTTLSYVRRN